MGQGPQEADKVPGGQERQGHLWLLEKVASELGSDSEGNGEKWQPRGGRERGKARQWGALGSPGARFMLLSGS